MKFKLNSLKMSSEAKLHQSPLTSWLNAEIIGATARQAQALMETSESRPDLALHCPEGRLG